MAKTEGTIQHWIKQRRYALDLTQEDLAACIGCSLITVQKIESGARRPSKQMAERLAHCLHISSVEHDQFIRRARGEAEETAHDAGTQPQFWNAPLGHPTLSSIPTNLPTPLTRLIGREQTLASARRYLLHDDIRLLTFTGAPGIGKTRLSLQTALGCLAQFEAGVFFVELAPIADSALVASTIAAALGMKGIGSQPILDALKQFINDKRMLLVLDNFEQLLEAAPLVVELLSACPRLKVLVTSREVLHVPGEQQFPVSPLELPDLAHLPDLPSLLGYPAIALFVERAAAIDPDFQLAGETAREVAAICTRLAGLPLAIELAATHVNLLAPFEILDRLNEQLRLLTGPARYAHSSHLPARHQTMQTAIEWSYRLLAPDEQLLFARLGVFVSGWTLAAAEAVCGPGSAARSASLLDKSLLKRVEGNRERDLPIRRFTMLESIHEYALQHLQDSGEADNTQRRHADYFLQLAEQSEPYLYDIERLEWLHVLEQEHDNMRAALKWLLARDEVEPVLRLTGALGRFWLVHDHLSEGREYLSRVLAMPGAQARTLARVKVLEAAGELAFYQTDYPSVHRSYDESLAICRKLDDKRGIGTALLALGGVAVEEGDYKTAARLLDEGLQLGQASGDMLIIYAALAERGLAASRIGDYERAEADLAKALVGRRMIRDKVGIVTLLSGLGEVATRQGHYDRATALLEECLLLARERGMKWPIASMLGTLAWVALGQHDNRRARDLLAESMALRKTLGDKGGLAWCLEKLAEIALTEDQPTRAVCILGAAHALRESLGSVIDLADWPHFDSHVQALRALLGDAMFGETWQRGRVMSFEAVWSYALDEPIDST